MIRLSLLFAALAVSVGVAGAEVIQVPIPGLQGSYTDLQRRTAAFDLGFPVDSVRSVVIRCSGTAQPGSLCVSGEFCDSQGCGPWPCSLFSDIDADTGVRWAGWNNLDGSFVVTDAYSVLSGSTWGSLLDGTGIVSLQISGIALPPECTIVSETPPAAVLDSVTLIFDVVRSVTPVQRRTWGQLKFRYRPGAPAPR